MSFGSDVIVFKHLVKSPTADEQGNFAMSTANTPAPGCRHRPLTFQETAELQFDISTEVWRSTLPLFEYDEDLLAVVLAAKGNDQISVGNKDFHIIGGVRPHDDMVGKPFKMTIISKLFKG